MVDYIDCKQLYSDTVRIAPRIPRSVGLVVGIPRSGIIPAVYLSQILNVPYATVGAVTTPETGKRPVKHGDDIIIVDDSCRSGMAISEAYEEIEKVFTGKIYKCAIYVTERSKKFVDFSSVVTKNVRVFQWNIMNHSILSRACVDIDGVICRDPNRSEYTDENKYVEFVKNVKPTFAPRIMVGAFVTWRTEAVRDLTEEWLKKHEIQYGKLIMQPYSCILNIGRPVIEKARHKASACKQLKPAIFIESSAKEAVLIKKLCPKTSVLCIENWRML